MLRPAKNTEFKTLQALRNAVDLKFLGCVFARGLTGGVGVAIGRRPLGVWRFENGCFRFVRTADCRVICVAETTAQVATATRELAVRSAACGVVHGYTSAGCAFRAYEA